MAASDAKPIPIKNTAYRVTFPIFDADGDPVAGAASLDSEVSKDGGTFTDCTNEATEIATSSGVYYLDLTSTEMNADTVAICVKTSTSGAKTTILILYPQEAGDIKVDVETFGGTAGAFSGGRPEVNASHWGGTAVGSAVVGANMVQISGDAAAADNLEAAADGTGYNLGGGLIVAASVTGAVGSVTGDLGGNVGGNVVGSVASVTAGVTISGTVTTLDALDSALTSAHGSGAWTTATGFSTHSAADVWAHGTRTLTSGGSNDWTADERDAIRAILGIPGSGTTPADPSTGILDTIRDLVTTVDTVVDAIQAKTDNLPADPAAASALATVDSEVGDILTIANKLNSALEADGSGGWQYTTLALENGPAGSGGTDWTADERTVIRAVLGIPGSGATPADPSTGILDTIRDLVTTVDTVADGIKAKTDNLPSDPADQSSVEAAITAATSPLATASALSTLAGYVDTEVAAILLAVGTNGVVISSATGNQIADQVLRRTMANVEASGSGDAVSLGSLYGLVQMTQEFAISSTTLTVKKTDGSTTLGTKTITTEAAAEAIRGIA